MGPDHFEHYLNALNISPADYALLSLYDEVELLRRSFNRILNDRKSQDHLKEEARHYLDHPSKLIALVKKQRAKSVYSIIQSVQLHSLPESYPDHLYSSVGSITMPLQDASKQYEFWKAAQFNYSIKECLPGKQEEYIEENFIRPLGKMLSSVGGEVASLNAEARAVYDKVMTLLEDEKKLREFASSIRLSINDLSRIMGLPYASGSQFSEYPLMQFIRYSLLHLHSFHLDEEGQFYDPNYEEIRVESKQKIDKQISSVLLYVFQQLFHEVEHNVLSEQDFVKHILEKNLIHDDKVLADYLEAILPSEQHQEASLEIVKEYREHIAKRSLAKYQGTNIIKAAEDEFTTFVTTLSSKCSASRDSVFSHLERLLGSLRFYVNDSSLGDVEQLYTDNKRKLGKLSRVFRHAVKHKVDNALEGNLLLKYMVTLEYYDNILRDAEQAGYDHVYMRYIIKKSLDLFDYRIDVDAAIADKSSGQLLLDDTFLAAQGVEEVTSVSLLQERMLRRSFENMVINIEREDLERSVDKVPNMV